MKNLSKRRRFKSWVEGGGRVCGWGGGGRGGAEAQGGRRDENAVHNCLIFAPCQLLGRGEWGR